MRVTVRRSGELAEKYTVGGVPQNRACSICTYVVPCDDVATCIGATNSDTQTITRYQVSIRCRNAANCVAGRINDSYAVIRIAFAYKTGNICPNKVTSNNVVAGLNHYTTITKTIDDQPPNHTTIAAGSQCQASRSTRSRAIEFDFKDGIIAIRYRIDCRAGLRIAINRYLPCNIRQRRGQIDGFYVETRKVKIDGIRAAGVVSGNNSFAQRNAIRAGGGYQVVNRSGIAVVHIRIVGDNHGSQYPRPRPLRHTTQQYGRIDKADVFFQHPVAAECHITGKITARRHVSTGKPRQFLYEHKPGTTCRYVTAVEQNIGVCSKRCAPLQQRRGLLLQCLAINPACA